MRIQLLVLTALVGFATVASAQSRDQIVDRLNADLTSLQSLPGDVQSIAVCMSRTEKAQQPEQCRTADRIMDDLKLVAGRRPQVVPFIALAHNLIRALSGRESAPDALLLLSTSIVDAVEITYASRDARTPATDAPRFSDSIMRAYGALFALGVSEPQARGILQGFVSAADRSSRPHLVQPIPPAPAN
jgi:hypothetical protein